MKLEIKEGKTVSVTDLRIMIAVAICALTATALNHFGLKFTYGTMKLEIIQKMTACISCLLCVQDDFSISKKAGINRIIITIIGGLCGMLVAWIDTLVSNEWLMILLVAVGVLATLVLCKLAKVPYINARIGGVTFILVACTLTQNARMWYAFFRLISTIYGVLVVLLVTGLVKGKNQGA